MKYYLEIRPPARVDSFECFDYYSDISQSVAERFDLELDEVLNRIAGNPNLFQIRYRDVRVAYLQNFPIGVHYLVFKKKIQIIAIFHTKVDQEIGFGG